MITRGTSLVFWILTAGYLATIVGQALFLKNEDPLPLISLLQVCIVFVFTFIHGKLRYGGKSMLFFFFITQLITLAIENLSIVTGFPFGHYHYAPVALIPLVGFVPVLTSISYFVYGYIAWCVANTLLSQIDSRIRYKYNVVLLPILASLVLLFWNFVTDPISSTLQHKWIWENSGSFNGVPLTNFFGWMFTLYLFYQIFALSLRSKKESVYPVKSKLFWLLPIVFYLSSACAVACMYFSAQPELVQDAVGKSWDVKSIYATAALASTGMMLMGILAIIRYFFTQKTSADTPMSPVGVSNPRKKQTADVTSKSPEHKKPDPLMRF